MDVHVPLSLLLTTILLLSLGAGYALHALRGGSASTRRAKQPPSPAPTPPSDSRLADIAADQAQLFSTLEKLTTTVKRLSSRQGMRDAREREEPAAAPPPIEASKAEKYRYYGVAGKTPREIAQHQLDLETSKHGRPN